MPTGSRKTLWFEAPKEVRIKSSSIPIPGHGQVLVQSICSAISAGSELLAYRGLLPDGIQLDSTIDGFESTTTYPVQYGYSIVGEVVDLGSGVDKAWRGKRVFVFHQHESHFVVSVEELIGIPDNLAPEDAVFLANMETAVSLIQDGKPIIGEKVAVMGMGVVGHLLATLLSQFPLLQLDPIEPNYKRRVVVMDALLLRSAREIGSDRIRLEEKTDYDLVYETSGSPDGLDAAIKLVGYHGRLIVASWYGKKPVSLDLGAHFHRSKLTIYASQVSHIDPVLTGRWSKKRRIQFALKMLEHIRPRYLITHEYTIEKAAQAYGVLDASQDPIQVIITY